ncbi:MAG TPA: phosphotransferase, partial [Myxococcales bacterium]|nr:phosphotransferase [Myxococcales bacterium]
AALHAISYPRGAGGWPRLTLAPAVTAPRMAGAEALWIALEENARPFFAEHGGAALPGLHRALIATVDRWWRPLEELPRTLIHHDFNPRNLALRRTASGPRLCAYDWELAAEGIPQRDLAELLVFTVDADTPAAEVEHCVELHRRELERASGRRIDVRQWRAGLAAALGDLLVNRLALYAVIHRFQRQAFLPRVVRTWARLAAQFPVTAGVGQKGAITPTPRCVSTTIPGPS